MTDFIEYRLMEPIVIEIARQVAQPYVVINTAGLVEILVADTSEHFHLTDPHAFGVAMTEVIFTMIVQVTGSFTDSRYHVSLTYYLASRLGLTLVGTKRKDHTVADGNEPYQ